MEKLLISLSESYPVIGIVALALFFAIKYIQDERKRHKKEMKELQEKMDITTNEKIAYLEKEIDCLSKKNVASAEAFERRGRSFDESVKAFQKAIEEFSKISTLLNSLTNKVDETNDHMGELEENLNKKIGKLELDMEEIKYITKNK